jgi:transcriptional regulator with XRE-family HTH domain
MSDPITHENLRPLLRERGLRDRALEGILGLSQQTVSNLMTDKRKITYAEQMLLRWEFYGEVPVKA